MAIQYEIGSYNIFVTKYDDNIYIKITNISNFSTYEKRMYSYDITNLEYVKSLTNLYNVLKNALEYMDRAEEDILNPDLTLGEDEGDLTALKIIEGSDNIRLMVYYRYVIHFDFEIKLQQINGNIEMSAITCLKCEMAKKDICINNLTKRLNDLTTKFDRLFTSYSNSNAVIGMLHYSHPNIIYYYHNQCPCYVRNNIKILNLDNTILANKITGYSFRGIINDISCLYQLEELNVENQIWLDDNGPAKGIKYKLDNLTNANLTTIKLNGSGIIPDLSGFPKLNYLEIKDMYYCCSNDYQYPTDKFSNMTTNYRHLSNQLKTHPNINNMKIVIHKSNFLKDDTALHTMKNVEFNDNEIKPPTEVVITEGPVKKGTKSTKTNNLLFA
jgi:hypothetical protein